MFDEYQAKLLSAPCARASASAIAFFASSCAIGDYKQDSYYNQGMGETNILPLDNDPIALRHQIWLATDEAYKAAGEALTEKQAALKQFSAETNPVDDFAKAPVVAAVEPTVSLQVDAAAWKKTLEDVTSLYRPVIPTCSPSAPRRVFPRSTNIW